MIFILWCKPIQGSGQTKPVMRDLYAYGQMDKLQLQFHGIWSIMGNFAFPIMIAISFTTQYERGNKSEKNTDTDFVGDFGFDFL